MKNALQLKVPGALHFRRARGVTPAWASTLCAFGYYKWLGEPILKGYLEGQGNLVIRLIASFTHIVTLVILVINLLTKSPMTLHVIVGIFWGVLGGPMVCYL